MLVSKEHRHLEGTNGPDVHVQFVMKKDTEIIYKNKRIQKKSLQGKLRRFQGHLSDEGISIS